MRRFCHLQIGWASNQCWITKCICLDYQMYLSWLQNVFVKIIKCICPNYKMYCICHLEIGWASNARVSRAALGAFCIILWCSQLHSDAFTFWIVLWCSQLCSDAFTFCWVAEMQSFGSSLMQTTISINDIKLKAHHRSLLLAHHYSISTVSLQHHCSIPTASLQQHYSISTASLKQHYSIPAASLQHHYSISSAALQQHQGKVRMQVSPVKILQLIVI